MTDTRFYKLLIFINCLVPLALLAWDALSNSLGANPIEFFLRTTGVCTLTFLLITLAITPLRKILGLNGLIRFRRTLGLYTFFYGCLHLATYSIFDKSLDIVSIVDDVWQRPFIALGMLALILMVPLAVTSTNAMIKRLGGKRWQRIHRLSYVIAVLGVAHFYLIQKSDVSYPVFYGFVLAMLLGYRIYSMYELKKKPDAH